MISLNVLNLASNEIEVLNDIQWDYQRLKFDLVVSVAQTKPWINMRLKQTQEYSFLVLTMLFHNLSSIFHPHLQHWVPLVFNTELFNGFVSFVAEENGELEIVFGAVEVVDQRVFDAYLKGLVLEQDGFGFENAEFVLGALLFGVESFAYSLANCIHR